MSRLNLRRITVGLMFFAACALFAAASQDQTQQPAPAPVAAPTTPPPAAKAPYQQENPEQLQQLVAPIALYPDPLVASVLAASAYPSEIAQAYDWYSPRKNLSPQDLGTEADKQSWDPSVKSLLAFPPVLQNLATNLSWTSQLGDAYYNQPTDVTNAIQEMRRDAKKHKILKSNDQIEVKDKNGYITIQPKNPDTQVVYVPAYDPWIAYGYPIVPWPGWVDVPGVWYDGPGLYFGIGFGLGPFWGFGWGWPAWGFDWWGGGIWLGGGHYWGRGYDHWDRGRYYGGHPGFGNRGPANEGFSRGFTGRDPGLRSGPFGGYGHGAESRGFSARGQQSFGGFRGGGFGGGGFGGGGFRGGGFGGGGFHGGGGGRR